MAMNSQPSAAGRAAPRGGMVPPLVLAGLLLVWLITPVVWLLATGFVSPHSGTEPNPEQVRAQGWVNLTAAVIGELIPIVTIAVALLARRRVLAGIGGIAFLASNLALLFLGIPVWQLFSHAINMIVHGRP